MKGKCPNEGSPCFCTGECMPVVDAYPKFVPDYTSVQAEPDPDEKSLIQYLPTAAEIYKLHPLPNHRPMKEVVTTVLEIARLLRDGDSV